MRANTLIRSTPDASHWWSSVERLGLYEAMCSGRAAMSMLDSTYPLPESSVTHTSGSRSLDLFGRLEAYARTALRREVTASLAFMLCNFQKFLLLSSCAVLYHTGMSGERVFGVVKICLGDVSDRYCVQILRTVVYLNRLVDILNAHGWKDRASELLLICVMFSIEPLRQEAKQFVIGNEPPSWYYAMASSPRRSLEYLKTKLSSSKFTADVEQCGDWTPFFIPVLVHQILDKKFQ